ncbi:MAG: HDIG domain-containing protein [candidate division Zixibacteria bacterium]|nr:HDIG domain-containing protein [candidate division Zixibacteria bacterium]
MKSEIIDLFPEINQIKDEDLKKKVISVWEEAIKQGGWKVGDLEKIPFTLLIPDCRVNIIEHTRAVTHTALEVAKVILKFYREQVKIDLDLLLAGGVLHDVGKLLEYTSLEGKITKSRRGKLLRHPFSGASLAYKHGLPDEVIHMIATHAKEGDGGFRSIEAMLIHYADYINFESLGGKV